MQQDKQVTYTDPVVIPLEGSTPSNTEGFCYGNENHQLADSSSSLAIFKKKLLLKLTKQQNLVLL